MKCNGLEGLCRLDITQVTLAGSHNSGAGFDSHLRYHDPAETLAISCFYRSQQHGIYTQLEMGIRYLDIDACWEDDEGYGKEAWSCHGDAYGGKISKILNQVDRWMNERKNRNEVIVIHFNRDADDQDVDKTGADIIKQLKRWKPKGTVQPPKKVTIQGNIHATLEESIVANKRIYIIMNEKLLKNNKHPRWILWNWLVGFTWSDYTESATTPKSKICKKIEKNLEKRCQEESSKGMTFTRYDLYIPTGSYYVVSNPVWAMCNDDAAYYCRRWIDMGVKACFNETKSHRRTVNFIVVDYIDEVVVNAAKKQNEENIKFFH